MKTLLLTTLLATAFFLTQSVEAQIRLGVQAGVNASNVKHKSGADFDPLLGYQGGLVADINLSSKFSIRPSLLYTTKGFGTKIEFRNDLGELMGRGQATFRPNYLELPLLLLYKVKVGKTCKIFGGLGPYTAAGINGKSTVNFVNSSQEEIVFGFGSKNNRREAAYNRMDYGLAAAVGLDTRKVSLAVNYSHGLTQISPNYRVANLSAFSNRSLSLTAGYWFGK